MDSPAPAKRNYFSAWVLMGLVVLFVIGLVCSSTTAWIGPNYKGETTFFVRRLDEAIQEMMKLRNVPAPPTYLLLTWNYDSFLEDVLNPEADQRGPVTDQWLQEMARHSRQYLQAMFPEWDPSPIKEGLPDHNGLPVGNDGTLVISGGQVLLLLLGGYDGNGHRDYDPEMAGMGFAKDPHFPFGNPTKDKQRKYSRDYPSFNFRDGWICPSLAWKWNPKERRITSCDFPGCCDWSGMPIAYIRDPSLGKNDLGVCRVGLGKHATKSATTADVLPVLDAKGVFLNAGKYQIIAAGIGGTDNESSSTSPFGPGGIWWPKSYWKEPPSGYRKGDSGFDDITNFWPKPLGESK